MFIIGCDYHPRFQKIAMLDQAAGELTVRRLEQENGEAKKFYTRLPKGTLVGIEATGCTQWFERLMAECGHELWVGDPAEHRRQELLTLLDRLDPQIEELDKALRKKLG